MGTSETFQINVLLDESHSSGACWQQGLWLIYSKCQDWVNCFRITALDCNYLL